MFVRSATSQMASIRFSVGSLLLLLATPGNVTHGCNLMDLEVDTNLTINVNCSRFDPTYNYVFDEEFQYTGTNNGNRFTVQYTCRTNSSLINTTDGLLKDDSNNTWPIFNPAVIAPTNTLLITTLPYTFTTGDECTFSGCYHTPYGPSGVITRAIQPTSCVIDLDECTSGANDCDDHAECINTIGSFQCRCTAGYTGDGKNCQNINECSEGTDNCSENAVCRDTDGSYDCSCLLGYDSEEDEFKCTDIDECTLDTHNCSETATCTNTDGGYNCSCNSGFEGDGFNCSEAPCDCGENADCVPNGESFICVCQGVESEASTDDCLRRCGNLFCDARSECKETNGSFACECPAGYEESGNGCANIDECKREVHNCSLIENSLCEDVEGSFRCTCQTGFRLNDSSCLNINECAEGTHDCSPHASCIDSNGSYSCRCNSGYDSDGVNCRIGAVVWVFGVGASTVLVLAVALTVLVCCIIHGQWNKKEDIYQLLFIDKWKDELDPNFAPVNFEVSEMKLSPSVISIFDTLEKFSNEGPFKGFTSNGYNENTNSSLENIPPVGSNLLNSSPIPPTSKKENASKHQNFSATLNRDRSISSALADSSNSSLSQSSTTLVLVPHQTSDYIKDTDLMSQEPKGRPVVSIREVGSPSGYVDEPIRATVQMSTTLTVAREEFEACVATLSGERDESLCTDGPTLTGYVSELPPMTVAQSPNFSATISNRDRSISSVSSISSDSGLSQSSTSPLLVSHQTSDYIKDTDLMSQGRPVVSMREKASPIASGYVDEPMPATVQTPATLTASSTEFEVCVVTLSGEQDESVHTDAPILTGYVPELLSMTVAQDPAASTTGKKDSQQLGKQHGALQSQLTPSGYIEELLPGVQDLAPHTENSQAHVLHVGNFKPSGYVEEVVPMTAQCSATIAANEKGILSQPPCKTGVQAVLTNTPTGYVEEVSPTSTHNPTMRTANREDNSLLGNLHESGQVMLYPTEQSLPTTREHANDCTIQERSCYIKNSSFSTEHTPTIVTKTDFQSFDVLTLESDNTFIDTSDTETLEDNGPRNLTSSSTRSRVADSCSSLSSGYMSYSSFLEGSDSSSVQLSNQFIKDSNGYLQDRDANSSQSWSGYISTAETFRF